MSEKDEKLSVLLDEYSDDEAARSVLNEVVDDVNLQYQMRRYQMIGDVMRHELPTQIDLDLSHQIMSEIRKIDIDDSTRAIKVENSGEKSSFWSWTGLKPLAGFAVAASVAVVSVTLWQSVSVEVGNQPIDNQTVSVEEKKIQQLVSLPVQANALTVSSSLNQSTRWVTNENADSPALQQKLNGYLVNHTEYSIPMQGLIPQARVAGFDSQQ